MRFSNETFYFWDQQACVLVGKPYDSSPLVCFNSLDLAVGQATGNADGGWLNDSNLTAGGANSMQVATVLHDCFPCPIPFLLCSMMILRCMCGR